MAAGHVSENALFASSFDWFTGLTVSFVIGHDYFGFGLTTLKRKSLYLLTMNLLLEEAGMLGTTCL